jgi:hypothetical protein
MAVACILIGHLFAGLNTKPSSTLVQSIIIVAATWSAISGFTMQRKLLRKGHSAKGTRSTPIPRWRASHLIRLWSAVSVAAWGLVLRELGGSPLLADVLFGVGTILLLVWKPGAPPS